MEKRLVLQAFSNELKKQANILSPVLRNLWGSGAGRAAVGASIGAAGGALANPENRLGGAVVGGLAGGATGFAAPLVTAAGRKGFSDYVKHMGSTYKHAITGKGNVPIRPNMSSSEVAQLRKADKAGLTSIPGIFRNLKNRPKETVRTMWNDLSTPGKVISVAIPGVDAYGMVKNPESATPENIAGTIGGSATMLAANRLPLLLNLPLYMLGSSASRALGRGFTSLTGVGKKEIIEK